jgi:hypothetical protein
MSRIIVSIMGRLSRKRSSSQSHIGDSEVGKDSEVEKEKRETDRERETKREREREV